MKAQFKYAVLSGLRVRGGVFAVIFIMNTVFIILGALGVLPAAAQITAVSLGGIALAVMFAANIGGDVEIGRRMFEAPNAYLFALTPSPRWKTLLAGVTAITAMDIITMAIVIIQQTIMSINLAGKSIWNIILNGIQTYSHEYLYLLWSIPFFIACYLLLVMIILFCVTAKKSILYKTHASGLLAILLGFACLYIASFLQIIFAPFGAVQVHSIVIIITLGGNIALPLLTLLLLAEAAALFAVTSKLMERKMNI
jgi:hypothetical protein